MKNEGIHFSHDFEYKNSHHSIHVKLRKSDLVSVDTVSAYNINLLFANFSTAPLQALASSEEIALNSIREWAPREKKR